MRATALTSPGAVVKAIREFDDLDQRTFLGKCADWLPRRPEVGVEFKSGAVPAHLSRLLTPPLPGAGAAESGTPTPRDASAQTLSSEYGLESNKSAAFVPTLRSKTRASP
jgi:hypothetical protein